MFQDLKPYAEYATSESPWIRRVPSHWSMPRLKSVVRERSDKGYPDEPLLAATQSRGVIRKDQYEARTVEATKSLETLKLVCIDDFVISLRSFQGGIERAYARGIISPAYTILRASEATSRGYLTLLFKSRPFIDALCLAVTGIREGQNIEYPRLARETVPLPPRDEQRAIVTYLAHAHQRVNTAITAKRRLIALHEEEAKVMIAELLTGGPHNTVRADGLRPIPQSWRYESAARICVISTGVEDSGNADPNGAYPFYVRGREVLKSNNYLFDGEAVMTPGDGQGGTGKVFHYFDGKFQAHQRVYVLKDFEGVLGRYFFWYMSMYFREHALSNSNTVTMESLRRPVLASFPVALPPIAEQAKVVERVESLRAQVDRLVEVAKREIALLEEFRTRLTADVVTGQVDVRAIAATLPGLDLEAALASAVEVDDVIRDDANDDGMEDE
ncbi:restriction endonuclease subunit S [Cellulomonas sp.]|uniref:restriction endonuclease subunit S n=1 Tax=Cellulomonas sp. TaxID=40001 RepID=UPI003BA949A3